MQLSVADVDRFLRPDSFVGLAPPVPDSLAARGIDSAVSASFPSALALRAHIARHRAQLLELVDQRQQYLQVGVLLLCASHWQQQGVPYSPLLRRFAEE